MPVSNSIPINNYTGNSSVTSFAYTFRIILQADLKVYLDSVLQTTGYTVTGVDNPAGGSVVFTVAPATGVVVRLQRIVDKTRQTDYVEGGALASLTLDNDFDRLQMQVQDLDAVSLKEASDGTIDIINRRIKNVTDPVNPQDAVTKNWAETNGASFVAGSLTNANTATVQAGIATTQAGNSAASATASANSATASAGSATNSAASATASAGSATASATSATNSAASATASAGSATTATTQAGIATTQAGIATTQATNASASATAAAGSATSASNTYISFDDRYLGSKAVAPTLDNYGGALIVGALYWDTVVNSMKVYDGALWNTFTAAGAVGGGTDKAFYENDINITTDYSINANKNAMSAGPITINTGVTVTVPTGSTWSIV